MKKTWIIVLTVMVAMFFASQAVAGWWGSPDQEYFDKQFNQLQRSVSEVKGDTTQIVSILGKVFEGSVPKGGTLTSLCNANGWNLIVLIGHNNISDPDTVAAGASFTYPKTAEEFQKALKNGKPLYDAWLAKQKTTFRVNRVKVDVAEIDELNVRMVNIKEKLAIKDMEIDRLKLREAEITESLRVKKAEFDELNVRLANFDQMNIDKLRVRDAKIDNLEIEKMHIKDALIDELRIKQLKIDNLKELLGKAQSRYAELKARPPTTTEPTITFEEKSSVCDKKGGCYGKVLTGSYQTLQPYKGVRLVANSNNPKYPENSITFKIEYHRAGLTGWPYGTGWGPTIVIRNPTMENPIELANINANLILPYLESATALKKGKPGNEGDSCWEVAILRDGTIYKNESPAEAPFRRK